MRWALIVAVQILWFRLVITFQSYDHDLYEGDNCTMADGVTNGTCRRDVECDYLKSTPNQDRTICAFDKFVSIVCCRDKPPSVYQGSRGSFNFKSDQMCASFPKFPDTGNHILNGILAEIGEFPYLGALAFHNGVERYFGCGANLISNRFMLTAAHCLASRDKPRFVRLGVVNIFEDNPIDSPVDIDIQDIYVHPNYTKYPLKNDIALIKLNRTVDENFLIPACLYTNSSDPLPDVELTIAGWGSTESTDWVMSPDLMKALVTTYDRKECNTTLVNSKTNRRKLPQLNDDQLCALGRNDTNYDTADTCTGDSGGPLELAIDRRRYIVGLTSSGRPCGTKYPGIYTRVSHFIDWIETVVWPA